MSLNSIYGGYDRTPGQSALVETFNNEVTWERYASIMHVGAWLDGASVDTGNTGYTHILRPGLLMARYTSGAKNGKWAPWDPTDVTGLAKIAGVLHKAISVHDALGADQDKLTGPMIVGGGVLSSGLIIPGNTDAGIDGDAQEHEVRVQMSKRFFLSDGYTDDGVGEFRNIQAHTASYTVLEQDSGTIFTNRGASGAVTFTLPATPTKGLNYLFYVVADQNVIVAGETGELIAFNDAAADSVAYSTTSEKIGGCFEVVGDGTSWLVIPRLGADSQTITIA